MPPLIDLTVTVRPPRPREGVAPRPGFSGLEMTNTELGDRVEAALADSLGWTPLVGAGAGKVRQGPFDMIDENGMYVEVKACSVYAKEYKIKSSAHALRSKMAAALEVEVGSVIVVVERTKKMKLRGWVYRRSGLGCFRLGPSGEAWEFVNTIKIK